MATPKRGLGKGLGALIPTGPVPTDPVPTDPAADNTSETGTSDAVRAQAPQQLAVGYLELPIGSVTPNPHQPRSVFDEDALNELVFSIKTIGLLQPIVVRQIPGGAYELVAGERRLRACTIAGLTHIPAIIRHTDDANMLRDALLENLHRSNLNALEEAAAYSQMLNDFGCTQDELAQRIGRSRPQVSNTLRLLKLPASVQKRVASGVLSAGHARALLALDSPEAMESLANKIVAEGLSVRNVEELISIGAVDGSTTKRKDRKQPSRNEGVEEVVRLITEALSDQLDTRVTIEGFMGKGSQGKGSQGKIVIECADIADARRISETVVGKLEG